MNRTKPVMLTKNVTMYGHPVVLACDGQCDKAWGNDGRKKRMLSRGNPDDYVFVGDDKLGKARLPGTSEGGHCRPSDEPLTAADSDLMNKWCARQCERCRTFDPGEPIKLPDMKNPMPNIPRTPDVTAKASR